MNNTSPKFGFAAHSFYYAWQPFGTWMLVAEIVLFGLVPALILLSPRLRSRPAVDDYLHRRWPAAAWC